MKFSAWFVLACLKVWWGDREYGHLVNDHGTGDWSFVRDAADEEQWAMFDACLQRARSKNTLVFSPKLISAVYAVWGEVSADVGRCSNMEAIELVLDANRLAMNGFRDADAEVTRLDAQFGFDKVQRALAKQVKLV